MERDIAPICNPSTIFCLCVTLTKHIVIFHYCSMMDLTFTETCGPLDCLSGSLSQINLHQIMGISKSRCTP